MNLRSFIIVFALLLGALIGWLMLEDATQVAENRKEVKERKLTFITHEPSRPKKTRTRDLSKKPFTLEDMIALPNQKLIRFKDEKSYRDFLNKLANSDLTLLGNIDRLRVVGVGYGDLSELTDLGVDEDEMFHNFPVTIPQPGNVEDQPGAVGFGRNALAFLGITGDNSAYGAGVKVAIIDTGVEPHLALSKGFQTINLVELSEGAVPHGHGTAVASLIAGDHPNLRGVAPSSPILSIRVADETGTSSSLVLADGIVAAVDNGAQIINISMGSYGNSLILQDAINYANDKGAVIFASSGNDGFSAAAYPAAHQGVISVGSVDANGTHLNFSNTSDNLGASAPGIGIQAAWPGDQVIEFTGTSASSPYLAGATAAVISETGMNPQQAAAHVLEYSNEAGSNGADPYFGEGILNVGRALDFETAGIEDIAVASQYFPSEESSNPYFQVLVENRGTETVWHSTLEVDVAGDRYPIQINSIEANTVKAITIPFGETLLKREGSLDVRSTLTVSPNTNDVQRPNNTRVDTFTDPSLSDQDN